MGANFTPDRGEFVKLRPFRYWCQKVLPLVYDDSLSYYELLCKVVDYLNKAMADTETLNGDVTNMYTAFDELQGYVDHYFDTADFQVYVQDAIDDLVETGQFDELITEGVIGAVNQVLRPSEKGIILIGDSYALDNNVPWIGWETAFENLGVGTVYKSAVGGSGFVGDPSVNNFQEQLESVVVSDPDTITDIVVMGGYNDFGMQVTSAELLTACRAFSAKAKELYPYAVCHFGFIAISYKDNGNQQTLNQYAEMFRLVCAKSDIKFIENAQFILMNKQYVYIGENTNTKTHPSTAGNAMVAEKLVEYLMNGHIDVLYGEVFNGLNVYAHNGDCMIFPQTYAMSQLLPAMTFPFNEWTTISDLSVTSDLLWGTANEDTTFKCWLPIYNNTSGLMSHACFRIFEKKLQINPLNNSSGLTLTGTSWVCAEGFTIPFKANYG